jgi:hypothetical protein
MSVMSTGHHNPVSLKFHLNGLLNGCRLVNITVGSAVGYEIFFVSVVLFNSVVSS